MTDRQLIAQFVCARHADARDAGTQNLEAALAEHWAEIESTHKNYLSGGLKGSVTEMAAQGYVDHVFERVAASARDMAGIPQAHASAAADALARLDISSPGETDFDFVLPAARNSATPAASSSAQLSYIVSGSKGDALSRAAYALPSAASTSQQHQREAAPRRATRPAECPPEKDSDSSDDDEGTTTPKKLSKAAAPCTVAATARDTGTSLFESWFNETRASLNIPADSKIMLIAPSNEVIRAHELDQMWGNATPEMKADIVRTHVYLNDAPRSAPDAEGARAFTMHCGTQIRVNHKAAEPYVELSDGTRITGHKLRAGKQLTVMPINDVLV